MTSRAWVLFSCALLAACSQAPQPVQPAAEEKPVKAAEAVAAEPAAQLPAESAPPSTENQPPQADPSVIVIDPGGEGREVDLVAASKAERERRAAAPRANRTITNKNLVKAQPGEKQPSRPAEKTAGPAAVASAAGAADGKDETYWRGRSRELRERWKEAVDRIAALESDADLLRRRFYAEADPYVRDGRIKPDWDRVLDRIHEMRQEAERRREELAAHLEEGRRAGALPGWLREGVELEPTGAAVPAGERPHEAIEPPIYPEPRETTDDEDGDG